MGAHNNLTNTAYSVYFNVIRKEEKTKSLSSSDKNKQDMSFFRCVLEKAKKLTGYSLYMWWFPYEIQVILERLFTRKPVDTDVGGLLGLIMLAGIDEEESDIELVENAYIPKNTKNVSNLLFDSQQNMSALLFGITVDDVSKLLPLLYKQSPVLTIICFPSILVS